MEALRILQQRILRQALQSRPSASLRQSFRRQHTQSYTSQQPFRTRPSSLRTTPRTLLKPPRLTQQSFRSAARRFQSTTTTTTTASGEANLSLSGRLKKLSREYGWSAVGVYLLLSALDFPFCFLAVKLLGTDRIGHWEHVVLTYLKDLVKWPLSKSAAQQVDGAVDGFVGTLDGEEGGEGRLLEVDHGYREAQEAASGEDASLWTQLVLAYAIHKSFIFVRVPLTAAVTPKVVKTLRSWGWNIGKMPKKKPAALSSGSSSSGVNTKGSGVKSD